MSSLSQFGKNPSYPPFVKENTIPIDLIVSAGGGGGGVYDTISQFRRAGGGGGGGQVIEINNFLVNRGDNYSFVSGQGGSAGTATLPPTNGSDSTFQISSVSRGNLPIGFGEIRSVGGGAGASYSSTSILIRARPGGCGGGAPAGLKSNNSTFYDQRDLEIRPGVASMPGTYRSSIVNQEGGTTTITISGYNGSKGDPYYYPTTTSNLRFAGGGGGGAGGEGINAFIESTTIMGGNGGPAYRSPFIPNLAFGYGGGGSFTFRTPPGASTNSSSGIPLESGVTSYGNGGQSGVPASSGGFGCIVISYPISYGPSTFTITPTSTDTSSRPGYYIYLFAGLSGSITFPT